MLLRLQNPMETCVRPRTIFAWLATILVLPMILGACASSLSSVKTFEDPDYVGVSFNSLLVIGVAGTYESRARWERLMAARISARGTAKNQGDPNCAQADGSEAAMGGPGRCDFVHY